MSNSTSHFWKTLDAALYLIKSYSKIKARLSQPIEIVYDVDDILWPLSRKIAKACNISHDHLTANYRIHENAFLTPEEQKSVIEAFSDPHIFEDIEFFPGVENILLPRELGAKVSINSNNLSAKIAKLKEEQLLSAIPGLSADDLHFNIIGYAGNKTFNAPMTILVDDCPYNIKDSPALLNIMPRNIAWSCNDLAREIITEKPVLWCTHLTTINRSVYELTKLLINLPEH